MRAGDSDNAPYIVALQRLICCPAIYDHLGDMMYITRLYNRQVRWGDLTRFNDTERERVDALVKQYLAKDE